VQGPELSIRASRGRVVLIDFWESTCINCLRTLPYLKAWHERYAARGLAIVGVHTPELEMSADPALVAAAVRDEGLPWSVLLDADRATWTRFANKYWPALYLIDARGYLRYERFGEGAYGETEEWIQKLLREAGDTAPMPEILEPVRAEDRPGAVCHSATRETHLGFHRGRLLAAEGYRPGEEVRHAGGEPPPPGTFGARGLWLHEAEYLESREPGAGLDLVCDAAGVNLVLAPDGELEIEVDGAPVRPEGARGGRGGARRPHLRRLGAGADGTPDRFERLPAEEAGAAVSAGGDAGVCVQLRYVCELTPSLYSGCFFTNACTNGQVGRKVAPWALI
jgi:thiol-disulfide isomerase/thioredoxin